MPFMSNSMGAGLPSVVPFMKWAAWMVMMRGVPTATPFPYVTSHSAPRDHTWPFSRRTSKPEVIAAAPPLTAAAPFFT